MGECSRREESLGMFTGNTLRAHEGAAGEEAGSLTEAAGFALGGRRNRGGFRAELCTACLETGSHCAQTELSTGTDRQQQRPLLVRQ